MIKVFGTSHVSEESIELIDEKIEEFDPEIVAIELDPLRLNSMVSGENEFRGPLSLRIVKKLQEYIGSKTGVMPGDEMFHAYRKALEEDREVALVDQDIRVTIQRFKQVRRREKVKAAFEAVTGLFIGGSFDIEKIPEQEFVEELLEKMGERYPELYQVFVSERNRVMAEYLEALQEENPESDIVVFVGAAHRKGLEELLDKKDLQ